MHQRDQKILFRKIAKNCEKLHKNAKKCKKMQKNAKKLQKLQKIAKNTEWDNCQTVGPQTVGCLSQ